MPTHSKRCRPFTLGDAMILVAATAIGLWAIRVGPYSMAINQVDGRELLGLMMPLLMTWTLGFLVLRLRRPRPTRRRLMRQAGLIASIAVVLNDSLLFLIYFPSVSSRPGMWNDLFFLIVDPGIEVLLLSGLAVIASWIMFAIAGNIRGVAGWIDGFGITLGLGWIILTLLCICYEL